VTTFTCLRCGATTDGGPPWPPRVVGICIQCGTPHAAEGDGIRIAHEGDLDALGPGGQWAIATLMREAPFTYERGREVCLAAERYG
jgi:hypothetical protein